MIAVIISFLPPSLVVIGLAFAALFIGAKRAFSLLLLYVAFLVAAPFIDALLAGVPLWMLLCAAVIGAAWILRMTVTALFGAEAAGHVIGRLVWIAGTIAVRVMFFPVRAAGVGLRLLRPR